MKKAVIIFTILIGIAFALLIKEEFKEVEGQVKPLDNARFGELILKR